MKTKVLEYLNGLVSENTTKAELDLIEYAKKAVRVYVEKEPKKKAVGVEPPTLDEIVAYTKEKGYNVDANRFYEYYSTSGWKDKDGKAVKNWKLKLVVWNKPIEKGQFMHNDYSKVQISGLITNLDEVEL